MNLPGWNHYGRQLACRSIACRLPKNRSRTQRSGQSHPKPLRFEPLESRQLLSADWQFQLDRDNDSQNKINSSFLDTSQHLYLAGTVRTSMDLDPSDDGVSPVDTGGTGDKGFIASYAPDGSLDWAQRVGSGTGTCTIVSIAVGADGSVVAAGGFGGAISFGTDSSGNECNFSAERTSGFVAKYGSDHLLDWAVPFVSDWALSTRSIAVDESGNVYVTGGLEGTNQLGDFSISEVGPHSAFVAKLGALDGEVLWVRHDLGGGVSDGTQIAVDKSGKVAVAGIFDWFGGKGFDLGGQNVIQKGEGDVFVAQLDSETGKVDWTRRVGGTYSVGSNYVGEVVKGLVFDKDGSLCLTGTFEQTADFGEYVLSSAGERDAYIAKFDNIGNVLWARSIATTSSAYGNGITTDAEGNVFVAGSFLGVADLDPGPLGNYVDAGDTNDAYFLKLNCAGNFEHLWHVPGIDSTTDTELVSGVSVFAGTDGSLYFTGFLRDAAGLPTGTLVNKSLTSSYYVCKFTPQPEENQAPVAMGETYEIYQGQPLRVDRFDGVLVNDSDANLDSLAAVVEVGEGGPKHGTLVLDPAGGFVYVPDAGTAQADQFTYRVSDGKGVEALATATINIISLPPTIRYDSVNVPIGIADLRTIRSELVISDPFQIADLNVELSISHTRDADLDVYLISPQGTRVELFTDVGGLGKGFTSTILDDEAPDSITSGVAPFTGTYRPEGALSAFDGESLAGTWYLEITVDQKKQTGTLKSWSRIASPGSAAPQIVI
ncbi:MAG: Ig-like domain-containing protein, partial [Thermoguttaceae bacterium]